MRSARAPTRPCSYRAPMDPAADGGDRPAPAARVLHRPGEGPERRPAAESREDGHRRVVRISPALDARRTSALLLAIVALAATAITDAAAMTMVARTSTSARPSPSLRMLRRRDRAPAGRENRRRGRLGQGSRHRRSRQPADLPDRRSSAAGALRGAVRYEADIEPWLGDRIGGASSSASRAREPARRWLRLRTRSGARLRPEDRKRGHRDSGARRRPTATGRRRLLRLWWATSWCSGTRPEDGRDRRRRGTRWATPASSPMRWRICWMTASGPSTTVPRNLLAAIPPDEFDVGARATFENVVGENLDAPVSGALTATPESSIWTSSRRARTSRPPRAP